MYHLNLCSQQFKTTIFIQFISYKVYFTWWYQEWNTACQWKQMTPEWLHALWIYPCNDFRRQCYDASDCTLRAPWEDEYRVRLAISIGYESFEIVGVVLMITSVDDLDFLILLNFEVNSFTWDILATEIIIPTINSEAKTLNHLW